MDSAVASVLKGFLGLVVRDRTSGNPAGFYHLSFIYFAVTALREQLYTRCPNRVARGDRAKIKKKKLSPYPPHVQRAGIKR